MPLTDEDSYPRPTGKYYFRDGTLRPICPTNTGLERWMLGYGVIGMELGTFKSWLEAYGCAWIARDAQAAANLFTEDGTYQVTPFLEAMQGRSAILDYWVHVTETQRDVQFGYEILAVTEEVGIARWWASFIIVPQGLQTRLDGIFSIKLDVDGRCKVLREWWHKLQK